MGILTLLVVLATAVNLGDTACSYVWYRAGCSDRCCFKISTFTCQPCETMASRIDRMGVLNSNMSLSTYPSWLINWMSKYPNKSLEELVVPGTHHSGMYWTPATISRPLVAGWSKEAWSLTQYRTVAEQLAGGVRWLDLRNVDGKGLVSHGSDSMRTMGPIAVEKVFEDTADFLRFNPTEVVIIQLKGDNSKSARWLQNVMAIINKYPNLVYRPKKIDGETTTPVGVLSHYVLDAQLSGQVYSVIKVRYWEDCFAKCQKDSNCIGANFFDANKLDFAPAYYINCILMSNGSALSLAVNKTGYHSFCKTSLCARGRIIIASEGYHRHEVLSSVASSWRNTHTAQPTEIADRLQAFIMQAGTDKRNVFKILDAICTPTAEMIAQFQLEGYVDFALHKLGPRCNLYIWRWLRDLSPAYRSLMTKKVTSVNTDYVHPDMVEEIIKLND